MVENTELRGVLSCLAVGRSAELSRRRRFAWLGFVSLIAIAVPASAETSPATSGPTSTAISSREEQAASGDIVVTARRREERLQDIPATVSALGGDAIRSEGARQLKDISQSVSGFTFASLGGVLPVVSVRGDSNRIGVTEPGVGFFIDGIFINRQFQLGVGPVDAARVEILKGPQSALYGKNTIAGAVNIITNDPTFETTGRVEAGIGTGAFRNELVWHAEGEVSAPLVADKVAIRLTAAHQQRDGYLADSVSGRRGLGYDATYLRAKLLINLTDNLSWRVSASYRRDNAPRADVPVMGPGAGLFLARPGSAPVTFGPTIWDTRTNVDIYAKTRSTLLISDLRLESAIGTFTSLTGYQISRADFLTDTDTSALAIGQSRVTDVNNAFSQEFRLVGSGGGFTWLGGVYYLSDDTKSLTQVVTFGADSSNLAAGVAKQRVSFPVGGDTAAVFGQVGYDLTSKFNFTGGLRYAYDRRAGRLEFDTFTPAGVARPGGLALDRSATFRSLTGNAVASYKFTPTVLAYASFSTGTKQGGFSQTNNAVAAAIPYKEQKVKAYEAGFKTDVLNRRIRFNVAGFYNDYSDLQLQQTVAVVLPGGATTLANITTNAAKARAFGTDVEFSARLVDSLRFEAVYTYLDSRVTEYNVAPGVVLHNIPTTRSPKHSGRVGLIYSGDIGDNKLTLNGNIVFKSKFTNDIVYAAPNLRLAPSAGYYTFNASASYDIGSFKLSAYVNNIANKQYYVAQTIINPAQYYYGTPGEPRTFEVSVGYKF